MRRRRGAAVSWTLALLATLALAVAGLLLYAERTVFDTDAFAARAAATLESAAVRDAAARRLTDAVLAVQPNLVALRPLVQLGAGSVVATPQFRSLVRRAALDAHRAAFDGHARRLTVQVRDAGLLLAAALRPLRPDLADRVPTAVPTPLARIAGTVDGGMLRLAEAGERAAGAGWIALGAALLLALGALAVTDSRRASIVRLGSSLGVVGAVVALLSVLAGRIAGGAVAPADGAAVRAALAVWLRPVTVASLAAALVGIVAALAGAAIVRPVGVLPPVRRLAARLAAPPPSPLWRVLRALAALALGAALVAWPRAVLTAAVVVVGALAVLAALAEIVGLAAGQRPAEEVRGARRRARVAGVAAVVAAGIVLVAVQVDGEAPAAPRVGRCNGHAALCDRRLDQVALLGTHNSMAAAGEPGWLFAAQDAGILQQLDYGVRALLIDTHYGIATPRGVATDLGGESRAKLVAEVGEQVVSTAEGLRKRIGANPTGEREIFLCHTFCEVGATRALTALREVHRFLVMHPEEVLVLSIQDDTSAADTAKLIRDSGLADEVYLGGADRPWPTLRELIDRDERVIVLAENHAGGAPWIHSQPAVAQETPYRFRTAAALAADDSCRPNRGGTAGSLFLVNHWIDTSPAPRVTIAREVNARAFLDRRLALCRRERGLLPNVVAIDFYRQGDAAAVVDELNRVG